MNGFPDRDWSPETYARFRGFRLRPALDLLAQVGALPEGPIVDLGCGDGAAGPVLAARFDDRSLIGVDLSPAMLEKAAGEGCYDMLERADIGRWMPNVPPALIFSNAALHWLPDHPRLIPRLAGFLAPGGTLAVQMPRQFDAPSHRILREVSQAMFPDRFDWSGWAPPVFAPGSYHAMLAPIGHLSVWETEYLQQLAPEDSGHPVRRFTMSTAARPILEKLNETECARFLAACDDALASAYPGDSTGHVLFPFRRLFFVLVPG